MPKINDWMDDEKIQALNCSNIETGALNRAPMLYALWSSLFTPFTFPARHKVV